MGDNARQAGPTRLHVPGQPPPGAAVGRNIVVEDAAGNKIALPMVYTASLDEQAARQIYAIVRNAVSDGLRDFHAGIAAMTVSALRPVAPDVCAHDIGGKPCMGPTAAHAENALGHEFATPGGPVQEAPPAPAGDPDPEPEPLIEEETELGGGGEG